ncbi:hypothetical protein GUITHDRAFT_137719 [Guillardia theta CCMP2712]|uniref:Uncharacterized protein n=1 Tax=Guillardia theta (strain CCMP2712) TaxID=905079 RepID=L1JF32_GUITC|nr:hypothetical protein GUITHDRAFT_137719 [Guillardia theta CCMP2712]EKX47111.1 hypothetical protein GUITHDRAFT_137719 [Guillardia theta CCMP2712]|eukprot:XP_005834091.1 hypothetical protein GUITHDRAFT_137719 [Guillardia theta CCMP2712]
MSQPNRRLWLLLLALLAACPGVSSWPSWIEIHVEHTSASAKLRPGNVTICDGGTAKLAVSVQGGTGPWKAGYVLLGRDTRMTPMQVTILRDSKYFDSLLINPAAFSWSSTTLATETVETSLPGKYTLGRVCDAHFCNGTVSTAPFVVSVASPPTARILHSGPICLPLVKSFTEKLLELQGVPPFQVELALVGTDKTVSVKYPSAGKHVLPNDLLLHRGLWGIVQLSDNSGCAAEMESVTWVSTLAVQQVPTGSLSIRSDVCGNEDAQLDVKLDVGVPPWSFSLLYPNGTILKAANLTRRTFSISVENVGSYSLVSLNDSVCSNASMQAQNKNVQVSAKGEILTGRILNRTIQTCPGVFHAVSGEVQGKGPWSIVIHRNGEFWRRIEHHRDDSGSEKSGRSNFTFQVEVAGNYSLYSVTDARSCTVRGGGLVQVVLMPAPTLTMTTTCKQDVASMECAREADRLDVCVGEEVSVRANLTGDGVITIASPSWNETKKVKVAAQNKSGWVVHQVDLSRSVEFSTGQYTITSITDRTCSRTLSYPLLVHPRPVFSLRGGVTDVCSSTGQASLEVRESSGYGGRWTAHILQPSGKVMMLNSTKPTAQMLVKEPGVYTLVDVEAGGCKPVVEQGVDGKPKTVAVSLFESPKASISGGGSKCSAGGAALDVKIHVQGGQRPYKVQLAFNGKPQQDSKVTSPDGVLVLPVSKEGTYTISHVRDARQCAAAASDITGSAIIKSYPQAIAGFQKRTLGFCVGEAAEEVVVSVKGNKAPAPWNMTILKDEQFYTTISVPNSSRDGGHVTFRAEASGDYRIAEDTFTDSRGCLGRAQGSLKVVEYLLPSVAVRSSIAPDTRGLCEGAAPSLELSGSPPWSVTLEVKRKGAKGRTCTITNIHDRSLQLSGSFLSRHCGTSVSDGFLPEGNHVITSVSSEWRNDAGDVKTCSRKDLSIPIRILGSPSASLAPLVCKHLCKGEAGGMMVNLTHGTPPFTVQIEDEGSNVLEQDFEFEVGEFRLDKSRIIKQQMKLPQGSAHDISVGSHNWTIVSVRDANG